MSQTSEHHAATDEVVWEQTPCPLCGEDAATPVLSAGDWQLGYPGEFTIVRCGNCGHAYLNPRPAEQSIGVFYPQDYGPYRSGAPTEEASSPAPKKVGWLRRFVRWFVETKGEFVPPIAAAPRKALEVGCAHGGFLARLQGEGWEVEGVEFSPQMAEMARSRGLNVQVGTLESAELPLQHYDAVFLWMVLEHLYDPRASLAQIRRILKPDGYLVFSLPNFDSWERRLGGRYWYALELPRHLQHFSVPTLRRLLNECGFITEQVIYQRNANSIVGSWGYRWRDRSPQSAMAAKLIHHCDQPRTWLVLLLAIPAKLLAWFGQAGRLTVVARPRSDVSDRDENR